VIDTLLIPTGAQPGLRRSNFLYRHPDLADRIRRPTAAARAHRWIEMIEQHHGHAASVLDLGCWTGLDAHHLARRYEVVGVDIQPHLIDYARAHRPDAQFQVGDMRTVRLGRSFDVILCVGNSLAYALHPAEVGAVFATFAAHAHPGSLLVVHTLLAPITPSVPPVQERVQVGPVRATCVDRDDWCPVTRVLTTHRTWRHEDGSRETDLLRRRVLPAPELRQRARAAGWDVHDVALDPPQHAGSAHGAVGYLVATWRGDGDHAVDADDHAGNRAVDRAAAFGTPTGAGWGRHDHGIGVGGRRHVHAGSGLVLLAHPE
jgi:SAM-dependent methyltransferase